MDTIRSMFNRFVFISIQGMTLPVWARLLVQNRFRVHPIYWPRAAILTLTSIVATIGAALDTLLFGSFTRRAKVQPPLIILGHFRSGTTHLHNLLALDDQFAYPTLFATLYPDAFLVAEPILRLPSRLFLGSHRPQDNVALDPTVPAEDEVAVAISSLASPYLGWVFPARREFYDRYLTFEDVPEAEVRRWQAALLRFARKLSWRSGRPLILKSPTHTARIARLLEIFPDARFIHIRRNPYEVFLSTRRLQAALPPYFNLQRDDPTDRDERILDTYARMYDAYFAQRRFIPRGRLCEVSYEDLERDPLATMATIYETLDLAGFETLRPRLERYLSTLRGYRKNTHPDLPEALRARIAQRWRRCFESWGYPTHPLPGPRRPASVPSIERSRTVESPPTRD